MSETHETLIERLRELEQWLIDERASASRTLNTPTAAEGVVHAAVGLEAAYRATLRKIAPVRAAAEALAASPVQTCETCRHAGTATSGTRECYHPEWDALGIQCMSVPVPFGCTLHQPVVPSPTTQERE